MAETKKDNETNQDNNPFTTRQVRDHSPISKRSEYSQKQKNKKEDKKNDK